MASPRPPPDPTDPELSGELRSLILDSIHDGVFTVDAEFRITFFNQAAERIIGVPRELAVGKHCYEVFRTSICEAGCALKATLFSGRPIRDVRVDALDAALKHVPLSISTTVLRDRAGRTRGGVEVFRDLSEVESLRQALGDRGALDRIIGHSQALRPLLDLLPDVAASDATVLVQGPSGTGKELVARAIHDLSPRATGPFVRVNCAALPDTLLESELFGHVRGAFTDARADKPGRFAQANHGTIFLDEVGDVSPAFQAKLLRVLQDREVQPLGSTRAEQLDVRIVAATHRDLAAMVQEGTFREDLYFRIRVVPLTLPPLRERREDIPLLVHHFLQRFATRTGKPVDELSPEAMAALQLYDFPGNIRELENAIERAVALCRGSRIELGHLPEELAASAPGRPGRPRAGAGAGGAPAAARTPEAIALRRALEAHGWRRDETARALGLGRTTLWRRMRRLGLVRPR